MNGLITALIGIGGGLALMTGSLCKRWSAAGWCKKILFFSGLAALGYGSLGMIMICYGPSLTARQLGLTEHYKTLLGGIILGCLVALFVSGELSPKKWKI